MPSAHTIKKLGKRPQRVDHRTLKLAKYLRRVPLAPTSAKYFDKVPTWPMYLNDSLGDCVIAAPGHMIQQWTAYASTEVTIPVSAIMKGYEDVGGYRPGDPSTDNGCDMLTACNYWRKTGFGGHKILAFVQINPANQVEVQQAIWLFGNAFAGLQMPLSAQDQQTWSVPPSGPHGHGAPGSWGGHAVPLVGYDNLLTLVSWGEIYQATWDFLATYCDEMYAIVSADWINLAGDSPSGFDLQQLLADLAELVGPPAPSSWQQWRHHHRRHKKKMAGIIPFAG